ncbi:MAG: methyltransferase domain-containing protein [Nanoarchaeota archaeon]|nr:methyltransferase domain-containing protein [Nanoarchaeota archaeon]
MIKMLPPEELILLSKCLGNREDINFFYSIVKGKTYNFLLDCGCGDGSADLILAKKGFKIIAMDVDQNLISYAKKNNSYNNIEYLVADFKTFLPQKKFDIISFFWNSIAGLKYNEKGEVINHLKNYVNTEGLLFIDSELHPFANYSFSLDGKITIKTFINGKSLILVNSKGITYEIKYWFHTKEDWENLFKKNNFYDFKFEEYLINNNKRVAIYGKYKN